MAHVPGRKSALYQEFMPEPVFFKISSDLHFARHFCLHKWGDFRKQLNSRATIKNRVNNPVEETDWYLR